MSAVHPITRHIIDALLAGGEEGLDDVDMKVCANLVLDTPDPQGIGVELIALARRIAESGAALIAEQIVVLAGLALGDTAGATVASVATLEDREEEVFAIPTFKSTKPPEGSIVGGPLAQAEARAAVSGCPFHRMMDKITRKKTPARRGPFV